MSRRLPRTHPPTMLSLLLERRLPMQNVLRALLLGILLGAVLARFAGCVPAPA